jgi:hypothetical protein
MIIALAIVITAVFIYIDATKHKIGKIEGLKTLLNMSAGAWGGCTLGLAILTIPLYFINRNKLIERARVSPVELGTAHRVIVSIVLLIVGVAMICVQILHMHTQNG